MVGGGRDWAWRLPNAPSTILRMVPSPAGLSLGLGKAKTRGQGERRTYSLSRSFTLVLERVWASTVLTMTAQARLGPSLRGSGMVPGTTTE